MCKQMKDIVILKHAILCRKTYISVKMFQLQGPFLFTICVKGPLLFTKTTFRNRLLLDLILTVLFSVSHLRHNLLHSWVFPSSVRPRHWWRDPRTTGVYTPSGAQSPLLFYCFKLTRAYHFSLFVYNGYPVTVEPSVGQRSVFRAVIRSVEMIVIGSSIDQNRQFKKFTKKTIY